MRGRSEKEQLGKIESCLSFYSMLLGFNRPSQELKTVLYDCLEEMSGCGWALFQARNLCALHSIHAALLLRSSLRSAGVLPLVAHA